MAENAAATPSGDRSASKRAERARLSASRRGSRSARIDKEDAAGSPLFDDSCAEGGEGGYSELRFDRSALSRRSRSAPDLEGEYSSASVDKDDFELPWRTGVA